MNDTMNDKQEFRTMQYALNCQIAEKLARQIVEHVANHCDINPDNVDWGHIGTVNHVIGQLREVQQGLGIAQ